VRLPATAKWIGLALLGLAIAVAVAIAASNLASQQIGIASESISAGDRLAPAFEGEAPETGNPEKGNGGPPSKEDTTEPTTTTEPTEPPETTTEPTEPTETTEPGDDHGGEDGDGGEDD